MTKDQQGGKILTINAKIQTKSDNNLTKNPKYRKFGKP